MSRVFENMYTWAQSLDNEHIDEDHQEIEIYGQIHGKSQRRTVLNHIVRVRGDHAGTPVIVCWEDYHSIVQIMSTVPSFKRSVLDVFVADKSLRFEGFVQPAGVFHRWLRFLGVQRGIQPHNHPVFSRCWIKPENSATDVSEFDNRSYCDALLSYMSRDRLFKAEFQQGSGLSTYYITPVAAVTPDYLQDVVMQAIGLLTSRGSS